MKIHIKRCSRLVLIIFLLLSACTEHQKEQTQGIDKQSLIGISPGILKAGDEVILNISITVPEGGIKKEGSILFPFYMKPWNGLLNGVSADKKSNEYVSVERSDEGALEIVNVPTNPEWDILSDLKIVIRDTDIAGGEKINVTFGSPDQRVMIKRKQETFLLEVEVDADADGKYQRLDPPDLPIAESIPEKLHVVVPSYAQAGEEFEVIVYAEDKYDNVCETYNSFLDIYALPDSAGNNIIYQMHSWDTEKELDRNSFKFSFDTEGIYYINAYDKNLGISTISNPVMVFRNPPEQELYWGEIHVHSQLSDGRGELQDLYRDGYARGLDFVAITDHNFGRNSRGSREERIREICAEADRFNRPGEFITIPAGETHFLPVMHMNFYFDKADPDYMINLVNSIDEVTDNLRKDWKDKPASTLEEEVKPYWEIFNQEQYAGSTLVFPHHTMWLGIKPFLNPERMRVIEVYSVHGTSEIRDQNNTPEPLKMKEGRLKGDPDKRFSVRELLDDNMSLGFTGGSDNHDGQSGFNAITGIHTNDLSRTGIIKELYDKDCYATSANRSLIRIEPEEQGYHILIAGEGEIDQVEIISNGESVYQSRENPGRIYEFTWTPDTLEGYFYVRVYLNDGHDAAWSSPVWL